MKKWFIKNTDGILVGVLVFIVGQILNESFILIFNELSIRAVKKIFTTTITIPLYYLVLLPLLWSLFMKITNVMRQKNRKLQILKARYFTDKRSTDITRELNNAVENNHLKIVLSNQIAGDPHKGERKRAEIIYNINGKEEKREYWENDVVELP